jgi:preprotein translocase subunit SecG
MKNRSRGTSAFLPKFLGLLSFVFLAILAAAWYVAEKTDPVILDERGAYRSGGGRAD